MFENDNEKNRGFGALCVAFGEQLIAYPEGVNAIAAGAYDGVLQQRLIDILPHLTQTQIEFLMQEFHEGMAASFTE